MSRSFHFFGCPRLHPGPNVDPETLPCRCPTTEQLAVNWWGGRRCKPQPVMRTQIMQEAPIRLTKPQLLAPTIAEIEHCYNESRKRNHTPAPKIELTKLCVVFGGPRRLGARYVSEGAARGWRVQYFEKIGAVSGVRRPDLVVVMIGNASHPLRQRAETLYNTRTSPGTILKFAPRHSVSAFRELLTESCTLQ